MVLPPWLPWHFTISPYILLGGLPACIWSFTTHSGNKFNSVTLLVVLWSIPLASDFKGKLQLNKPCVFINYVQPPSDFDPFSCGTVTGCGYGQVQVQNTVLILGHTLSRWPHRSLLPDGLTFAVLRWPEISSLDCHSCTPMLLVSHSPGSQFNDRPFWYQEEVGKKWPGPRSGTALLWSPRDFECDIWSILNIKFQKRRVLIIKVIIH